MFSRVYKFAVATPPSGLGYGLPARSLCLLFCYSFWSVSAAQTIVHDWNLQNYRELFRVSMYPSVLLPLHAHRRIGDGALAHHRISTGVLSLVPRARTKTPALPTRDHSPLGELPGSRLCVEDDSWHRWCAEHSAAVCAPDASADRVLPLQPFRRVITLTHIYTPFVFLPVYAALEHVPRNLIEASNDLGASPLQTFLHVIVAVVAAGSLRRRNIRIRAQLRRLSRATAARRTGRNHDLERGCQPVWCSLQLAARSGDFALHAVAGSRLIVSRRSAWRNGGVSDEHTWRIYYSTVAEGCTPTLVFAFLYLPIAILILYSFNGAGVGGFPPHDFTLKLVLDSFFRRCDVECRLATALSWQRLR